MSRYEGTPDISAPLRIAYSPVQVFTPFSTYWEYADNKHEDQGDVPKKDKVQSKPSIPTHDKQKQSKGR